MENRHYSLITIKILLILIIVLYFSFLYIDILNPQLIRLSDSLKFTSIILCFTVSILGKENVFDTVNIKLLQIGLFFTVVADLFLLTIDSYYILGVGAFCIVQIIYSVRYDIESWKITVRNITIILVIILIAFIITNLLFIKIDLLIMIAIFYGICLLISVIKAIKTYTHRLYPKPNGIMVAIGMILFLLCDINVALYNIFGIINITDGLLYNISLISIWLFYLPSQVLLALSGMDFN
ncbi:lysoplasmalogenase [Schnuerera sp. xch1]|uniref:lysoplasmalogenase family protein n=1 Tax=Schnuerera sp. xch1 TaxID=2874283 RepID=UPI001CC0D905|nr:lysoplasmalogenase family protein [Schnuerera sp. xch1]MBZ2175565.1 lysoplasmalogenase [Schnuerera sp. xch1]